MQTYIRILALVAALAVTAAIQPAANATSQAESGKSSHVEKALKDEPLLAGKVVETMDAGAYSYVLLENKGAKTWVAVPRMKLAVGQEVAFQPGIEMANFPSRILKRTFDIIYFSAGPLVKEDEAAKAAAGDKEAAEPAKVAAHPSPAPAVENVKVEKAQGPNSYTVGELYQKGSSLDKQKVVVKGQVVKVSSGIMGKNWIHLRDGSGDAAQKTNNLVVTTQDEAAVGDVVTASGTLYKDKDFGSGYKYGLIMEEATLKK